MTLFEDCYMNVLDREAVRTINGYDEKMIYSGYSLQDRVQIVEPGLADYDRRLERLKSCGGTPHLTAEQTLLSRTRMKLIEKATWYKGSDQIIKVPPRQELAQQMLQQEEITQMEEAEFPMAPQREKN